MPDWSLLNQFEKFMNFRKVNNITGWVVFLIALATYFLTREARGSLWDTGEFIACAKNVGLPHPPGAPLFVLLGRFFIILFGDDGQTAAAAVNFMSALASAATILFLFWSVTHFARKMYVKAGEELSKDQLFTVMAAGVVGALAYTFSDSFWFSAVEGEVYALSSFFTALVFWAMLKWEHADENAGSDPNARARSDRWIVFLFFMIGLSIGVHLLNLLVIPAIVMIYYYRRYTPTTKGAIWAFLIGCAITGLTQVVVIKYSMKAAGIFDVFFVNNAGMPFFSGFAIYFILLSVVIWWALRLNEKKINQTYMIIWFVVFFILAAFPFFAARGSGITSSDGLNFVLLVGLAVLAGYYFKPTGLKVLKLSLWSYAFMMLGYFMYFTALIRSNANPAVDMNNVDNPINLVYYLSREQYGEAPLVYGPHFAADVKRDEYGVPVTKELEMQYVKGDGEYIATGRKREYEYESEDKQLFPRIWDNSNDQGHAEFYKDWLDLGQDPQTGRYEAPTYGDNIHWFFTYQMGLMYWRYFMWNFAGRQNDIQGLGNKRDGNWISGISFMDNQRLGDQSQLPDSIKDNKAKNKLYMIPFLLGVLGCVYQFLKNKKDWIVSFLLFFFTGIAIVLYLNQPGNQPRERDYAYVGSFYAFAIWIGLAVVAFARLIKEKADKEAFQNTLLYGSILTFFITLMSSVPGPIGDAMMVSLMATAMFAGFTAAVTYGIRAASGGGGNGRIASIGAAVVCMIAPLLMAQQEWDDHDRSHKTTAPDIAKDYLESCAPNAIIFCFGDNDTYPLWYAQEVEGVRKDIRIINNSLLGIDWYINQLRYKINDADSVNVIFSPDQIRTGVRDYVIHAPQLTGNKEMELYDVLKNWVGSEDPARMDNTRGEPLYAVPTARAYVTVNKELVRKNGTVTPSDSVFDRIEIALPDKMLFKNDLAMLAIIATNNWERPIYFTSPFGSLGFGQYLRKDGLAYRLVPVQYKVPQANWTVETKLRELTQKYRVGMGTQMRDNNSDTMYKNLMTHFEFGGANRKGMYYDEMNRQNIMNIRNIFGEAAGNLADMGKKDEAGKLIDKAEANISPDNLPYAMVSRFSNHNQNNLEYLEACYKAGKMELAEKIRAALRKDIDQQRKYYQYLENEASDKFIQLDLENRMNEAMSEVLDAVVARYTSQPKPATTGETPTNIGGKPKDTIK